MEKIRKIIREELYKLIKEIGEDDPIKLAQEMIKSNEEQVKSLEQELKFREADSRVSNLPKDDRDARIATAKLTKDRLEQAKRELELSKQSEINAVKMQQLQSNSDNQQSTSSQVQTQV
jgi:N-methylhydantoinase B/oxoprolinase/acetone carboxylase alpha subunit